MTTRLSLNHLGDDLKFHICSFLSDEESDLETISSLRLASKIGKDFIDAPAEYYYHSLGEDPLLGKFVQSIEKTNSNNSYFGKLAKVAKSIQQYHSVSIKFCSNLPNSQKFFTNATQVKEQILNDEALCNVFPRIYQAVCFQWYNYSQKKTAEDHRAWLKNRDFSTIHDLDFHQCRLRIIPSEIKLFKYLNI